MGLVLSDPIGIRLTPEEYAALPPSSRHELIDGVLLVKEAPTGEHQDVAKLLERQLEAACPHRLRVVREQEVRLGELLRRIPDLMVINASAYDRRGSSYPPGEVLLVIEVVSPSSRTRDRKHKLLEYADGGIRHYWLVEIDPTVAVRTYRLGTTGAYEETGLFEPGDTVKAPGLPWATIEVSTLEPS